MTADPRSTTSLQSRRVPLSHPELQLALLDAIPMNGTGDFNGALARAGWDALTPAALEIFQINLGKLCNMTCRHCHVDAGPDRTDAMMTRETIDACLRALDQTTAHTVDLTGGAPEIHPHFRYVVEQAVARGKQVIDRCNLSVLLLPRSAGLVEWSVLQLTPDLLGSGDPFASLAAAILQALPGVAQKGLAAALSAEPGLLATLLPPQTLVYVDQFEELFTTVQPSLRAPFVDALPRAHTIITDRALELAAEDAVVDERSHPDATPPAPSGGSPRACAR